MKRKQTYSYSFWLICLLLPILLYFTITTDVYYRKMFRTKTNQKVQRTFTTTAIYNPPDQQRTKILGESISVFYRLTTDDRYHYEFRYDINPSTKNGNHRVMILINGAIRSCADMWDFSVGIRILEPVYNYGYTILAICSQRRTYDVEIPIDKNNDAKYIYLSLQKWIHEVYYEQFKRYPLLYIHATSRGSKLAGILCRILPIQAQAYYIFPGHRESMLIPSIYETDLQLRLSLDPTFANWFYFDFCYNKTIQDSPERRLCPFQSDQYYYNLIPPTFFTFLQKDPFQSEDFYRYFLKEINKKSSQLGGPILTRSETLQLDILPPAELTPTYIQENFDIWRHKPSAAKFFYEHITNKEIYGTTDPARKTCWCIDIDFKYYENFANITTKWPKKQQYEYSDYIRDIRTYTSDFCELICGDLLATHAMSSRNINKSLEWMKEMDQIRRSFYLDDYLKRPLRVWMYDRKAVVNPSYIFFTQPQWIEVSKEYLMYAPEYFLQDYFRRLSVPGKTLDSDRFQWATNPLLADYFIIPSDTMYFYFYHRPTQLNSTEFDQMIYDLSDNYFNSIITSIRTKYPYWSLAASADEMGSNHILPITGGRNMGIFSKKVQHILRNVVQIAFTGIREELMTSSNEPRYVYRGITVTYRHHYDVIVPQFTPLSMNRTKSSNIGKLVRKKKRLCYFAGLLSHSTSLHAARSKLSLLMQDMNERKISNMTVKIQNKTYVALTIIDGHIETSEYIKSIQSSVFSLCPEGFLPWSPRLYESIQIGSIPVILADNMVLPFERFIDWRSLSAKFNVSRIKHITSIADGIQDLEKYTTEKLKNALPYLYAFRWPYLIVTEERLGERMFKVQKSDDEETNKNVFHYLWLELRCRRLEQWYGFTVNTTTEKSLAAQRLACTNHPTICPCRTEKQSVIYQEYV